MRAAKWIITAALLAVLVFSARAGTVYSNDFSSQATGWFTFTGTTLTQTNGILKMTATAGTQRGAEYNFGTQNLAVGDQISVKFDVYLDIISNNNSAVRWQLLNSADTKLTANTITGINATNYNPRVGYIALMDSRTSGGTGTATIRQDTVTNTMMSITGPTLGNLAGLNVFTSRWDTVVWSIKRTGSDTYVNSMSVNGGPVLSVTDTAGLTNAFDTFVIGAGASDAANYSIDNVEVSVLAGAGVIYSNDFSSQATGWFTFSSTTLAQTNGILKMTSPVGGLQRGAEYNFGMNNLAVGDKLSVKFDVYLDIISNANGVVRWELLNSAGTKLTTNTINGIAATNNYYNPRVGYISLVDSRTSGGLGTATIRQDRTNDTMMSIAGPSIGNLTGLNVFTSRWDTVVWSITRTATNTYANSMSVNGGTELYVTDTAGLTNAFDTFVIGASVSDAANYSIDNVQVSLLPANALTVTSGTGGGWYPNGKQVAIDAAVIGGKTFVQWTGDTAYLADSNSAGTTVTMPSQAVNVTATYVDNLYTLTVTGGSGGGSYTNGQQVGISATSIPGKIFAQWTGDVAYVDNVTYTNALVTMPAQPVNLWATYTDAAVTLTASAGAGGMISPTSTNVLIGGSADFVITANSHYRIATLKTNNADVIGVSFNNTSTSYNFTWSNVQASGTVDATFTQQVATNCPAPVPYEWLASYFTTNDYEAAANADQDGDGMKTWQEYIAGTVPSNAASVLKAAQTTRNVVTWSPVTGRVYSVYWSTNLVKGFTNLHDNIMYPQGSYTNTTPDGRVNHYQVKVRLQ